MASTMMSRRANRRCGQPLKSHDNISVANVGLRCHRCFSEEMAARMGVDFDNTPLQPVTVRDVEGVAHTFEFRSMLVGTGYALCARDACRRGQEGCEFSVLGDFEADVWDLSRELYDRIRRELGVSPRGASRARLADHRRMPPGRAASRGILSGQGMSRCW